MDFALILNHEYFGKLAFINFTDSISLFTFIIESTLKARLK